MSQSVACDGQKSLDAMWHSYRASPFVAQNCDLVPTSVVQALLNARYYNAAQGQFLSEDPVFLAIGDQNKVTQYSNKNQSTFVSDPQLLNVYSYSRDNPLTNKDPMGLLALRLGGEYVIPGWGLGANGGVYVDLHGIDYYYSPILATGGGGSVTAAISTADLQHVYSTKIPRGVSPGME